MDTGIEITAATPEHLDGLVELARFLDTVNLPDDAGEVREILVRSERSFGGAIRSHRQREYVFVVRDLATKRLIGTSMIIAQLGRKEAPYIYFDVSTEEKYSPSFDAHFVHKVLTIGYSFNGPTEIGGLVVHPDFRQSVARVGRLISYVRFLWIAMHRELFQNTVLAELLPPLEADGTSHLWEAVGKHFTGIAYQEADKLSKNNKEFIRSLFPNGDIYASLLPHAAQEVIGKVGPQTKGVEKLLRRIGFRYVDRVDPFDGGPHFLADTDDITLIRDSRRAKVEIGPAHVDRESLVAVEYDCAPWFHAVPTTAALEGDTVTIPTATAEHLHVTEGTSVWVLPL